MEEELMRKYGCGYKHSKDLLNDKYVKELQDRTDKAIAHIKAKIKQCNEQNLDPITDIYIKILGFLENNGDK